jgi:hypothetical protein
MVQAQPIRSACHDVGPQEISYAGGASFVWSLAKIRIAALILFGAATPAIVAFTLSTPFVRWLCLVWLLCIALLMHGLSRRASDDSVVLSVDQRGILDRRLMARRIEWQEIGAICLVDTDRSHTVDIRLRWPRTTLDQTCWLVRIGAYCQIGYGVPAVTFSMLLLDGDVSELLEAVAEYRPDLLHYVNRAVQPSVDPGTGRIHENSHALTATQHPVGASRHQDESLRSGPGAAC